MMADFSSASLPPFRSSTSFPRAPRKDQLPTLYADCLQALHEANSARWILKSKVDAKKAVIAAIRIEIDRFEKDVALQVGTRASLHAMNLKLVEALREMDGMVEEFGELVQEAHNVPRTRWGHLFVRLKALIRKWRMFKRRQQEEVASLGGSDQDGES
jgi:hypothetical protein